MPGLSHGPTSSRSTAQGTRKARPDRTAQRLRRLAKTTGLSRTDIDLLELVLRYQTQPVIESMIDDMFRAPRRFMTPLNVQGPALPALLGVSANTVQARLRADAPLVRSGLVSVDSDGDLKALDRLNRLAAAPAGSGTDVHRLLLDAAPASELEWSDFDHVARDRDHIERVIKGALASGAPGVNILLHGPPGTGKTEFCRVLAERLDASLYSVGEFDDKGDEPMRSERLHFARPGQLQSGPSSARRTSRPSSTRYLEASSLSGTPLFMRCCLQVHQFDPLPVAPKILDVHRQQSPLAVREHGRGDVGVVDLLARNGDVTAESGQHRHDVRAVLEDRERGGHPRRVLQRVDHPERYRPGMRARDRDEVFADNLAADVQGLFAVAGPVEAPAGGDMGRGSHESGRDENVGIDEHPGQRSPPDAFSDPPVRLPKSS